MNKDAHWQSIIETIGLDKEQKSDYSVRDGLLYWKTKLVIPNEEALIN